MQRSVATANPKYGILMALTAAIVWGTLGVFANAIYKYNLDPLVLVTMRAGIAFVALLAIMLFRSPGLLKVERRDIIDFAYVGVVGIALEYWVYFETLKRTSSVLSCPCAGFVTAGAVRSSEKITRRGLAAGRRSHRGFWWLAG